MALSSPDATSPVFTQTPLNATELSTRRTYPQGVSPFISLATPPVYGLQKGSETDGSQTS